MALLLKTLVLLQVLKLASLDELEEIVASGKDSAPLMLQTLTAVVVASLLEEDALAKSAEWR